jgi:pimeloyl-ACP methyl ester carboxylesterase
LESVRHNDLKLSYKRFGGGNSIYLTFHGHGKDHKDFESFAAALNASIYSFDLYGHGASQIPIERLHEFPLEKREFETMMLKFFNLEEISEFSLMGYSLGGKIALDAFLLFPERTQNIILLAPDGFKNITWYGKTSQKKLLRLWYKKIVDRPKFFFSLIKAAKFLKLIPQSLFRFLDYQFASRERRFLAFQTWGFYRKMFPDPRELSDTFKSHSVKIKVIVGKYDSVIKPEFAFKFRDAYYPKMDVIELEIGHDFFKEKNLRLVQKELEKTPYL